MYESTTLKGMYLVGGAGYAGGIVSAAMDGMRIAVAWNLGLYDGSVDCSGQGSKCLICPILMWVIHGA